MNPNIKLFLAFFIGVLLPYILKNESKFILSLKEYEYLKNIEKTHHKIAELIESSLFEPLHSNLKGFNDLKLFMKKHRKETEETK